MAAEYEVDAAEAERDVANFVSEMKSVGLIEVPASVALAGRLKISGAGTTTLGDAIVKAKSNISDPDVRRTFVLFGDPAMKVKQPAASAAVH